MLALISYSGNILSSYLITCFLVRYQGAHAGLKSLKDRYQWWGREFRCSLSLNMDKLFPKAMINVLYH